MQAGGCSSVGRLTAMTVTCGTTHQRQHVRQLRPRVQPFESCTLTISAPASAVTSAPASARTDSDLTASALTASHFTASARAASARAASALAGAARAASALAASALAASALAVPALAASAPALGSIVSLAIAYIWVLTHAAWNALMHALHGNGSMADFDPSQPAGGGVDALTSDDSADDFDLSQPAPMRAPVALLTLVGGADVSMEGVPPVSIQLEPGDRLSFGRRPPSAEAGADVIITTRSDLGISRANGSIEYSSDRGVVLHRLDRDGFPTFRNGILLADASTTIVHGDSIGFGSTDAAAPSVETITYTADLPALGSLGQSDAARMPPPSVLPSRPASAASLTDAPAAEAGGDEAAAESGRERGERGGRNRNGKRAREDDPGDGGGGASSAAASAEDVLRSERAQLVSGLRGDPKRFALRALEMLGDTRSRLLDAVEEGAADESSALGALERVARSSGSRLRDLADDIDRSARRARDQQEHSAAQHTRHDGRQGQRGPAAQHTTERSVRIDGGGKGNGGGKGGGKGGDGGKGKGGRHGGRGGGHSGKGGWHGGKGKGRHH